MEQEMSPQQPCRELDNPSPARELVRQCFSTRHVPALNRAERWADMVRSINFSMHIAIPAGAAYTGRFQRLTAGDFQLVGFREDEALFERNPGHIRDDGNSFLQFLTPTAGRCHIEHLGHSSLCAPGHFFLVDTSEPMRITQQGRMSALILTVPRDLVEGGLAQPRRLCGRVFDARLGIGRAGLDLLRSLSRQGDHLGVHAFRHACRQFIDLMMLSLESGTADSGSESRVRRANRKRIRDFVREHLTASDLATPRIAAGVGLSSRYVQSLLKAADCTARDLIRTERLKAARALLESPLHRHRSVTEIAFSCGFSNSSHFSTAFRAQYAISPRDCRARLR